MIQFQNNHQVFLIGNIEFHSNENSKKIEWTWSNQSLHTLYFRNGGSPIYLCFAEYDKRLNCLVPLKTFQFYVTESDQDSTPATPFPMPMHLAEETATSPEISDAPPLSGNVDPLPINSPPLTNPVARDIDQTEPEDGPLFRATILNYERTTHDMRMVLKKLIKRIEHVAHSHGLLYMSYKELMSAFERVATINPPAFKPFLDHYYAAAAQSFDSFNIDRARLLRNFLIEPLRKIYDTDIKNVSTKKKDFEETSRDYYTSLSRYLSKSEKETSSDKTKESKFAAKKRDFELSRFDYYSYMQDINGGRKGQEVLSVLTSFAANDYNLIHSSLTDIDALRPSIIQLQDIVTEANKEFQLLRAEREERRRYIETSSRELEDKDAEIAAQAYKAKVDQDTSAKQGLLLAFSKSTSDLQVVGKSGWHKYWVVLDHGKICEYANWKQSLELHTEPIDLLMATVRPAQSVSRKFCFEVITPQTKRTYQATSKAEMHSWIEAIQYSISESIVQKGKGTSMNSEETSVKHGPTSTIGKALQRVASVTSPSRHNSDSKEKKQTKSPSLVKTLKEMHSSDQSCADCNTTARVEWCAINFPVVLCIDCSGIHRSLGTHITKIRSLTLDKFNPETVDLLYATGNSFVNEIYEGGITDWKIKNFENQERRVQFVKDKYLYKRFIKSSFSHDPNTGLLESIEHSNLKEAVLCLALGADVNYQRAVVKALLKNNYLIAELLTLNGASLNVDEVTMETLSARAQAFVMNRATP